MPHDSAQPTSGSHTLVDPDLGRIDVRTLPLPDSWRQPWGTYSSTGTVLVAYRTVDDPDEPGWLNLSVVEDDGTDPRHVYAGPAPLRPRHNGMRLLPFADGTRVLLSDYVLECDPSVDRCETATLVPLVYPDLVEHDPAVLHRWSEPIIAPDGEHIAWTTLHAAVGAYNVLGRLRREEDRYVVDEPRLVSDTWALVDDPDHPGDVRPATVRGGEVKQFARGGAAISLAGTAGRALVDSVLQALGGEGLTPLTLTPGYDETTILSPDETVGIVMTTRFSPRTSCSVIGLLPRPLAGLSANGLAMAAYLYSVAGVRSFRPGNIGPALVDLARATTDDGYLGADLSDPAGEWVYLSPMSWHPSSRSVAWNETLRVAHGGADEQTRIRLATLLDRAPATPVAAVPTPEDAPYSRPLTAEAIAPTAQPLGGRVRGAVAGHAEVVRTGGAGLGAAVTVETRYAGYSDDGLTFLDGTEHLTVSAGTASSAYRADLVRRGADPGEMRLRVTFTQADRNAPVRLSFAPADDGLPASHGFTTYRGTTLHVADMSE